MTTPKKLTVDELIDILERYGCPKDKSESCAVALICEHGYEIIKTQNLRESINSKKRLKEILDWKLDIEIDHYGDDGDIPRITDIDKAITEILKEFVHKDSLPNTEEIDNLIEEHVDTLISPARNLAEAIRKLIEGKK